MTLLYDMKLSMTGQEQGEILIQVSFNRGDRMDRIEFLPFNDCLNLQGHECL